MTQQFLLSLSLQRTLVVALLKGWELEVSSIRNLENNPVEFFYAIHSCFDAEKLFALKYAMTQLKCCKDKVGEAIKEVLVIEKVCFFKHAACFQQEYKLLVILFLSMEYSLIPKLGGGGGSKKSLIHCKA